MKVITIKEPYVSPIAQGLKHYETRSWKTNYRGEIFIHTSVAVLPDPIPGIDKIFPLGHIVLKARLTDCVFMDSGFLAEAMKDPVEYALGFYDYGRYAWKLEDVELIDPIPAKGKLGIWNYEGRE